MNKSELNVFRYGKIKTHTLSGLLYNIRRLFRTIRYAWQRAIRGYCNADTWNLDVYYTELMIDTLTHFKDNLNSFPGNEEWPDVESWSKYLSKIIGYLKSSRDEDDPVIKSKHREYALKMLNHCWEQLWD